MKWTISDEQDVTSTIHGVTVETAREFRAMYQSSCERDPFFISLIGENGARVLVGAGRCLMSTIQYSTTDEVPVDWVIIGDVTMRLDGPVGVEFLCGDTPTPVLMRHCLPAHCIVEVTSEVIATGILPTNVAWEQI
jgi:hypothetical protein